MYVNQCAPMLGDSFQPIRKGAFAELFVMYIVYVGINIVSNLQNPTQDQPKPSKTDDAYAQDVGKKVDVKSAFIDVEPLNKFFPIFYGYHIVALGIAIIYTPYAYTIIVAWLHFLGFIVILVAHRYQKLKLITPAYTWSYLMNLLLIIGGVVGIGWSNSC